MKLSIEELQELVKEYGLGEIEEFSEIEAGINDIYELEINSSTYILATCSDWIEKKIKPMKKVFDHLREKDFKYEVPHILTNSKGRKLSTFKDNNVLLYDKIEGEVYEELNLEQAKEAGNALGEYHKKVSDLKTDKEIRILSAEEVKNKMNELLDEDNRQGIFADNYDFYMKILDYLEDINLDEKYKSLKDTSLLTHSDYHEENLIFKDERLVGIIDFDNIKHRPKITDIAICLSIANFSMNKSSLNKKKIKSFIEEYEKSYSLNKKEKEILIPLTLLVNIDFFRWAKDSYERKEREEKKKSRLNKMEDSNKMNKLLWKNKNIKL